MFKLQPFKLKSQKGFGLWDTLLLVALIAALLLVAFVSQQSRNHLRQAQDQDATLLWADQQVAGFTSSHLRLPCPDTNNDGLEDCGSGTTSGLLPVQTLGLKADAATRGPVRILYSLLRPSGMDPTVLESYFEPEMWDGTKYSYGTANGLDFCRKLADIVAGTPAAVAYTVALKRLDEEPDLARSRSVSDLSNNLSCITTMSSVNGIALGVDVVNEVLDQQASTKQDAIITIAFNVLHIALTAIDVSLAAIGLAASITALAAASAALAGAVASCVVLVGCALIPPYTAAVVAAGVAIGLYAGAIALGVAAIFTLIASTALAIDVAIKTGSDPGDQTLDINLDDIKQAALDAADQATAEENKANQRYNEMVAAENAKNAAHQQVINWSNNLDPSNTYDADVNAALDAAVALDVASQTKDATQGDLDQANDQVTKLNAALAQQQIDCAGANLPTEQYKCSAVPEIQSRLVQAQQAAAVALDARNSAVTQFNAANTTYNAALNKVAGDFGESAAACFIVSTGVTCSIELYRKQYLKWLKAKDAYAVQHQSALDARNGADKAWAAYVQIRDQGFPSGTGSGSAITVWAGAEAILKQADANGVVE